jgi:hypothetical protein
VQSMKRGDSRQRVVFFVDVMSAVWMVDSGHLLLLVIGKTVLEYSHFESKYRSAPVHRSSGKPE